MNTTAIITSFLCVTSLASGAVPALALESGDQFSDEIKKLWQDANPELSLRYRYAYFDDDLNRFDASFGTLQTLLSLKTGNAFGFEGVVQFRNVSTIGDADFNSTVNGRQAFPVEPDPTVTEVDQAFLSYKGFKDTTLSVGRKKLNYGNQRFVSQVGWRQNHQSFDGLFLETAPVDRLKIQYSWAFNVNRIFTDESPVGNIGGSTHLADIEYDVPVFGKLKAYGYWLDFDEDFSRALETRTLGANLTGSQKIGNVTVGYVLEGAHQTDISQNPFDIDLTYLRIEPKLSVSGLSFRGGIEQLSGNGTRGFQTPLALLHAYNGLADRFLITPANGLEDLYIEAAYKFGTDTALKGARFMVQVHDFNATEINQNYGREIDAVVTWPLLGKLNALLKFAYYDADQFSVDTTRVWFQVAARF